MRDSCALGVASIQQVLDGLQFRRRSPRDIIQGPANRKQFKTRWLRSAVNLSSCDIGLMNPSQDDGMLVARGRC